ncbi:unnamed protein product [Closterium sp. NIES-65]|nr:unnamed protein product [Closterium sp. NIES-65]
MGILGGDERDRPYRHLSFLSCRPLSRIRLFLSQSPSLFSHSVPLFLPHPLPLFLSHPDSYYLSPPLVISHSLPLFLSSSLNLSHSSSLFLSSLTLLFSSLTFSLSSSLTLLSSSLTFSLSSSLFLSSICPSLSASLVVTPTFMARSKHHRLTPISCSNDSSSALPVPPPIMPLARIATSTCRLRACIPPPPNSLVSPTSASAISQFSVAPFSAQHLRFLRCASPRKSPQRVQPFILSHLFFADALGQKER